MKKHVFLTIAISLFIGGCSQPELETDFPPEEVKRARTKEAPLLGKNSPDTIPGEYMIRLHDHVNVKAIEAKQVGGLIATFGLDPKGVKISQVYGNAVQGFAAKLSAQNLKKVRLDARVMYIEQDKWVHLPKMTYHDSLDDVQTQAVGSWGLDRVDQRSLPLSGSYSPPNNASNVNAYILDTGILESHQEFGGRAKLLVNTTGDNIGGDCNGHGTHMGGTIGGRQYGLAKNVKLNGIKVMMCHGSGKNSMVVGGIDWLTANAQLPAVANMSIVSTAAPLTEEAVLKAMERGIIMVTAAGNDGGDSCLKSPGRVTEMINVMASGKQDERPNFSEKGRCADLFAPGDFIKSAWQNSNSATRTASGTSCAAPHVTGAAALLISKNPDWVQSQVDWKLKQLATKNKVSNPGAGSPNNLLYVIDDGQQPPTPPPPNTEEHTYKSAVLMNSSKFPAIGGTKGFDFSGGQLSADLSSYMGGDFDLYLQKKEGAKWIDVAASNNKGHTENITLNAAAGQYRWEVYAYQGNGPFYLKVNKPIPVPTQVVR